MITTQSPLFEASWAELMTFSWEIVPTMWPWSDLRLRRKAGIMGPGVPHQFNRIHGNLGFACHQDRLVGADILRSLGVAHCIEYHDTAALHALQFTVDMSVPGRPRVL